MLDPGGIVGAVASAVRISIPSTSSVGTLVDFFRESAGLLVLDNCEHLISGCAALVDTLLTRTDGLSILATSRHPLNAAGEVVRKLYPL